MSDGPKPRRRRARTTRASVRAVDRLARFLITVGGLGTILAVFVLCVFLVWVVVPLFRPARLSERSNSSAREPQDALAAGLDESAAAGWSLSGSGELTVFRLADGAEWSRTRPFGAEIPSAGTASARGEFVLGYEDGTVRLGALSFPTEWVEPNTLPANLAALERGTTESDGDTLLERTAAGTFRRIRHTLHVDEPVLVAEGRRLLLVDQVETSTGTVLASLGDDGILHVLRLTRQTNLLTGAETLESEGGTLALDFGGLPGPPEWLGLTGLGDGVWFGWSDGTLWRCDAQDLAALRVAEKRDLVAEPSARITARRFLLGRNALVAGDSTGRLRVWSATRPRDAGTSDGLFLVRLHEFAGEGAAVTAVACSARGRLFAAGYADGGVRLFHSTNGRELATLEPATPPAPVTALALSPKDDALLVLRGAQRTLLGLSVPHAEASFSALFRPVWYEGFPGPTHTWQTTGSDEFEPKFGFVPLVFGTLKATLYALLFGVPLALLAALYTSEFLGPPWKARVKPTIELMASLPSVVLGFLAALVLAPWLEGRVPAVLLAFALVPFCAAFAGVTARALPGAWLARLERWRLFSVTLAVGAGLALSAGLGPVFEGFFFGGDLRHWLTGGGDGGFGGWLILLAPLSAVLTSVLVTTQVDPRLVRACASVSHVTFARVNLLKFAAASVLFVGLAGGLAALCTAIGLDPRGGVLDTYVQRNALVVGFAMGFAILPLVYTLAEDALSAVPDSLRAASLGAGATTWQTAVRIVLPTAMSGIFSAVMIGFGRAVGETMIVLMAAGNTPVLDWNVFNGFRTLSANIATEMPEAVRDSTHYRLLFLSALVLLGLTSILNTLAELVRQRYRRRRAQL
jgi:phosphate transport system permease protein